VFKLLKCCHSRVARAVLDVRIGVRLLAVTGMACALAVLLAGSGIAGLAESKESLRMVYQARMRPVQQLARVANLMLTNRLLLQSALSELGPDDEVEAGPPAALKRARAVRAADRIEANIGLIGTLWTSYADAPLEPAERRVAARFAASRGRFVSEALVPAVAALRRGDAVQGRRLALLARTLYEQAGPDLEALNQMQFDAAHEAYSRADARFHRIRATALGAMLVVTLLIGWLGSIIIDSIVGPLRRTVRIFERIAHGRYDSVIKVEGNDEISQVMLALREMQTKLGINEAAIHELAFYDPLTKLPNRRLLADRLERALLASARSGLHGAVLMIDLDNFKRINDTCGHDAGDALLCEVAARLQASVRETDTVARLGGDEFIVMLVDLSPNEAHATLLAEAIGEKIRVAVELPIVLGGERHHSSASMGLCMFLGETASIDELLKRADMSMYEAKGSGRNALRFFDPANQAAIEARGALERELRESVALGELRLHYQPQVDLEGAVLGAEVLLRWQHPRHGLMLPDRFIPIAEESGLILPIGAWVLRHACAQLKLWEADAASAHLTLSVNVSARQFHQPNFVATVLDIVRHSGIRPERLKLELTESLVLHNIPDTVAKMAALSAEGIDFSMDDFGTGHSSLSHLSTLPIRQLKIDRSFVRHIGENRNDAVIVQTIIGMAHNLGLDVIAEGVETLAQRHCLEQFGCATFQGYLYGKPMPIAAFERRQATPEVAAGVASAVALSPA
jgi:diguanylate cyclase (GGDEF)-like protein